MILTCPQCSTQFKLDDALIGEAGRKVKCSSCAHVWHQAPVTEPAEDDGGDAAVKEASNEAETSDRKSVV